jgi:endonuclease/exonuclease/phosphatase family metal-dependent hydrolase
MKILVPALIILAAYVGAFLLVNHDAGARRQDIERANFSNLPRAGDELTILTWNLGYGGLGAGSDFKTDGGQHYFPPSRRAVLDNTDAIAAFLREHPADIALLQELAHDGPVNYWVNLKHRVDSALPNTSRLYFAEIQTRLMPWPLRLRHGQGIYSRRLLESHDLVALPAEDAGIFGVRRRYASLVSRLPIAGSDEGWTICSIHLAAFDEDAAVRTRQLRELMAWADGEYRSGRHVVIGGDWNLKLAETSFPNTTAEQYLFWVFPFPQDALPAGWRVAADAAIPSVRTNERAYRRGENYTTVIDGFIVSPNVSVEEVQGFDLDFAHSDHNPVRIRVRALSGASQQTRSPGQ